MCPRRPHKTIALALGEAAGVLAQSHPELVSDRSRTAAGQPARGGRTVLAPAHAMTPQETRCRG